MAYETKPGQGAIFQNNKTNDKQPDWRGNIKTPEGKEYEIALWNRDGKNGQYFSVNLKEPFQQSQTNNTNPPIDQATGLPDYAANEVDF